MVDQANLEMRRLKIVFFLAIIFLPNLFPFYQLFITEGYLFYQNAFDEYSYLSYDSATYKMGLSRFSRYPIKWLHEAGIPPGYMNFIFDLVCPGLVGYFIFKIFTLLDFEKNKSLLAAIMILLIPIMFGGSNPVYSKIYYSTLSSGWVYWLSMPEAYYPPFYRTPEPQLSYLLMAVAVCYSIKRKTFIPLYFVAPLLYGFLRVPFLFIVLSCHLSEINKKHNILRMKHGDWLIGFVSYIIVSVLIGLFYQFALKGVLKEDFFPATRLPLFSGTFAVCLLIWKFLPRHDMKGHSSFYAFVVAAPLVAANSQVVSGFISQPINFEQSFGVVCISLLATVFILSLKRKKWMFQAAGIFGILLSVAFSSKVFRINSDPVLTEKPSRELIEALREDSSNVVFESSKLASTMSMVFPKQPYTALAIAQSFGFGASKYFDRYLCVKEKIRRDPGVNEKYSSVLMDLDKGYKHLHSDFIFTHINRRDKFRVFFDVDKKAESCDSKKLYFYP